MATGLLAARTALGLKRLQSVASRREPSNGARLTAVALAWI